MISMQRVANEIQNVGLYDLILQDVQKVIGKTKVTIDEILEAIDQNPQILRDYKQTNVEYNLSNIHFKDIELEKLDKSHHQKVEKINQNLTKLREIEKYTLDFEHSSTLVMIFSLEFIVLFSVQYFIILLNLKDWQWELYSFFASSIVAAWFYAKREQKIYATNSKLFQELYQETSELIDELPIDKTNYLISECDEHI